MRNISEIGGDVVSTADGAAAGGAADASAREQGKVDSGLRDVDRGMMDRSESLGEAPEAPLGSAMAPSALDRPRDASDELLLEESTTNERTIAFWRLVLLVLAGLHISLANLVQAHAGQTLDWVPISGIGIAVLYGTLLFILVSRLPYTPWISFASAGLDVTFISGGVLATMLAGRPLVAVNNSLVVPVYLLAIALAGLRYNPTVTVFATLLAVAEYLCLLLGAVTWGGVTLLQQASLQQQLVQVGQFDWANQLARVLLVGIGGLIATFGVRRARELRTASIVDSLTQLFNRGFFDDQFQQELSRAERYNRHLSLVVLDVDNFKLYNDRHGHAAGDQVLREVADIMRHSLRHTDFVARYGGEEFVAVLPETSKDRAMLLAERLRHRVAGHSFMYGEQQPGEALTVSAGVATYPTDADSAVSLFEHADHSLYAAKAEGRNRIKG